GKGGSRVREVLSDARSGARSGGWSWADDFPRHRGGSWRRHLGRESPGGWGPLSIHLAAGRTRRGCGGVSRSSLGGVVGKHGLARRSSPREGAVERDVELENIHPGVTQKAELASLGVLV